jgi:hypothetical protein
LAAGRNLKEMLDKNLIKDPPSLYRLARKLFDSRYSEVSNAWSEVILSAIRVLPVELILNEVIMMYLDKGITLGNSSKWIITAFRA